MTTQTTGSMRDWYFLMLFTVTGTVSWTQYTVELLVMTHGPLEFGYVGDDYLFALAGCSKCMITVKQSQLTVHLRWCDAAAVLDEGGHAHSALGVA